MTIVRKNDSRTYSQFSNCLSEFYEHSLYARDLTGSLHVIRSCPSFRIGRANDDKLDFWSVDASRVANYFYLAYNLRTRSNS